MNTNSCRLCGKETLVKLFSIPACPNISYLPKEPKEQSPFTLNLYKCSTCSFVQLLEVESPKVDYEEYFMAVSYSSQMQECQKNQIKLLEKIIKINNWNDPVDILEVGCGDGGFINQLLASKSFNIEAIEPSKTFFEHAIQIHSNIKNIYLKDFTVEKKFQIIVAREVLEHVYDIHEFLNCIKDCLTNDGWVMIQVPRLETAFEETRIQTFFYDHPNYFSEDTLCLALEMNGFVTWCVCRDMGGEYTTVYAQRAKEWDWNKTFNSWTSSYSILKNKIESILKEQGTVCMWGAGGKGLSTLVAMNLEKNNNLFLVDCDTAKIGRYTPTTNFLIQDSEVLKKTNPSLVVILADAYRNEIKEKLTNMSYTGAVTYLGDEK